MKQRVYLLYGKNELGCISAYGSRKKAIEGANKLQVSTKLHQANRKDLK